MAKKKAAPVPGNLLQHAYNSYPGNTTVSTAGMLSGQWTPGVIGPGIYNNPTLTSESIPSPTFSNNCCVDCYRGNKQKIPALFFFHGNSLCEKCFEKLLAEKDELTRVLKQAIIK